MRDRNLDIYRGAIMIYITCFCHLIWWEGVKVGIFEGSWITGIFFAMATVFYIVGASFSLSLEKPFRTYLKGRIKRVAIPYWKYALVCFPAVVYHYWKSGEIIPLNDFISYVFFTPTVEYRLFDHIWFIPPYLIISLCLPFLCRMIRRCNIPFILFSVVLVLLLLFKAYYPELLQTVIVYLFFTIWGLYYKKKLGWQIVVCVIAAVGYLIYAFGVERVPYINIYSNEGYEIYLVHPFTIILLGGIKRLLGLDPIIADHLYLQMVYIVSGFLFILCVNVYVLKTYNYIWSMVNRVF